MDLILATAALDPADPTGLARGRYPAPAWLIWLCAGGAVALAVALLVVRLVRARRARSAGNRP